MMDKRTMSDPGFLLEAVNRFGRYVGSGTTFECASAEWRDGKAWVGIKESLLERLVTFEKSDSFAACLRHQDSDVRALASAVANVLKQPRRRTLWWKLKDTVWSSGPTVPIATECVRDLQVLRERVEEKYDEAQTSELDS